MNELKHNNNKYHYQQLSMVLLFSITQQGAGEKAKFERKSADCKNLHRYFGILA